MHILLLPSTPNLGKVVEISHMAITLTPLQQHVWGSWVENLLKILFYHEYQGNTQNARARSH